MLLDVVVVPGDDSGPELVRAARQVLDAAVAAHGHGLRWDERAAGAGAAVRLGAPLPDGTVAAIRAVGVALKGPTTTLTGAGHASVNIQLRQILDLYACVRPCRSLPGVPATRPDIDLTVVRENTEDLYGGAEAGPGDPGYAELLDRLAGHPDSPRPGDAVSLKPISRRASRRIAEHALGLAAGAADPVVWAAGQAALAPLTDGLFLAEARAAAADHPGVRYVELGLAAASAEVAAGRLRGVLLLQNLYGDVLSDVAAATVGGLGVAPGANIGPDCAVFEATHGSAPAWAGAGVLNPTAMILSGAMMLRHLGLTGPADQVEAAVRAVLAAGRVRTSDLCPGGLEAARGVPTQVFVDAVVAGLTP